MCKWNVPFWGSLALFSLCIGFCSAQDAMRDRATGKSFPSAVSFEYRGKEYNLEGTGVSTRKKFFMKVYSVAHYMEDPASVAGDNVFEQILDSDKAKQLTSIWVRNVGEKKVVDGYRDSFEKILSKEEMGQLRNEIDTYLSFFGNVKSGDEHVLRWMPDGTITLDINGEQKGNITNKQFARSLWGIWFSKRSVVKRSELVSLIK